MNFYQTKQPLDILVCEDNLGDVYIITDALKNSEIKYNLHHVTHGEAAIDYLQQSGDYKNASHPDLILLDLNLPKKHGFEVLKEIKSDLRLKSIPVVILTSSQAEQDVLKSYELYGNCFVTKPFELEEFVRAIQKIEKFWLNLVQLPPKLAPNS